MTGFHIDLKELDKGGFVTPYVYVVLWANGRLGREDGWSVEVHLADFGAPPKKSGLPYYHADAIRIMLFNPDGDHVYDTAKKQESGEFEFDREQSWRHVLDGGNISVHVD